MRTRAICPILLVICCAAIAAGERNPNFVIIFTDDQGYGDAGCYGARTFETPNLDRMAHEGVRFANFYSAQAVCSASRAALLTGCYPNRIGISGALSPAAKHGLSEQEKTIAEVLKPCGYATAMFGKWHVGHHPKFLPMQHGFDEYFGLPYSNDMWPKHPSSKFPDLPLIEGDKTIQLNPDQTQLTTWYTQRAVQFIEKNKSQPFFLYVAHNMPHVPLFVSEKFKGKSKQGLYGDVIMEIDWSVGQILDTLKRNGLDDNTFVIFTSDNGPWLSYGNHAGSAGNLREGKGTSYDGGIREPCIMRWPGRIPAGRVCREPAMTIDLLPTIAGLAGAKLPDRKIDGLDIWPLISCQPNAKNPHEAYYIYYENGQLQALISWPWKMHFPHTYRTLDGKAGGMDGRPAQYVQKSIGIELYNLESDPGETNSLIWSPVAPKVWPRLEELAEAARDDLGDSLAKRTGKGVRPAGKLDNN